MMSTNTKQANEEPSPIPVLTLNGIPVRACDLTYRCDFPAALPRLTVSVRLDWSAHRAVVEQTGDRRDTVRLQISDPRCGIQYDGWLHVEREAREFSSYGSDSLALDLRGPVPPPADDARATP